jgi:hypothetical protein
MSKRQQLNGDKAMRSSPTHIAVGHGIPHGPSHCNAKLPQTVYRAVVHCLALGAWLLLPSVPASASSLRISLGSQRQPKTEIEADYTTSHVFVDTLEVPPIFVRQAAQNGMFHFLQLREKWVALPARRCMSGCLAFIPT